MYRDKFYIRKFNKIVMVQVEKELIKKILNPYKKGWRFLKSADYNPPSIKGKFIINNSYYIGETGHLNAVDFLICYNQLAYVFFAQIINLTTKTDFLSNKENQLKKSLIAKIKNLEFKKSINPKSFEGILTLKEIIPKERAIFFPIAVNFGDGAFVGEIDLAYRLN